MLFRSKHKITSERLFQEEVEIMRDVILELNRLGIYVGYIYDALLCHPKDASRVKKIMDSIALSHNIRTTAKISNNSLRNDHSNKCNLDKFKNQIFNYLINPRTILQDTNLPLYQWR